ncbi:hypothetical protein HK104_000510 [Borealophlyctis nickersoniae]|nr:hypothetical protein HK104_000510 [Borealophlyctis nickersoniae]
MRRGYQSWWENPAHRTAYPDSRLTYRAPVADVTSRAGTLHGAVPQRSNGKNWAVDWQNTDMAARMSSKMEAVRERLKLSKRSGTGREGSTGSSMNGSEADHSTNGGDAKYVVIDDEDKGSEGTVVGDGGRRAITEFETVNGNQSHACSDSNSYLDRLNIEQLRSYLAERGLPTHGDEAELVDRLDSALNMGKKDDTTVIDLTLDDEGDANNSSPQLVESRPSSPVHIQIGRKRRASPGDTSNIPAKRPLLQRISSSDSVSSSKSVQSALHSVTSSPRLSPESGWRLPSSHVHTPHQVSGQGWRQAPPKMDSRRPNILVNPRFLKAGALIACPPPAQQLMASGPTAGGMVSAAPDETATTPTKVDTPPAAVASSATVPLRWPPAQIVEENGKKETILFSDASVSLEELRASLQKYHYTPN